VHDVNLQIRTQDKPTKFLLYFLHMKIVFLNTLNGKVRTDIAAFIKTQSSDTTVFCFQEVYKKMRLLAKEIFLDYKGVAAYKRAAKEDDFPQATYVNKNAKVLSHKTVLEDQRNAGLGVYTKIKFGDSVIHICNFHGKAQPGDKLDNPNRIEQSRELIDFFKNKHGPKIIGGDFNLLPGTKSVKMFEEAGYRNLIKEFKITTTRNRLAWDIWPPNKKQYYSDYVFVSPDIKVKKFSVPNIEISDHLPLILGIEL